ncbi:MAG: 4-hydroxy-tetrahydrodipicolinate synthase [Actinomycetota bacterium]|nr:MAG: 4-hydroxy-tetrahydrodipicolinate synthase [Actinomycetota bacterium]
MFRGIYTAIVTPFNEDGSLDIKSLEELIEFQIDNNIAGIVPVGTTGESPTLSVEEHIKVIAHTCKTVNGRVKVIAGTGSNNTEEAIELTRRAKESGADATLQVAPYYNKPTQEGIFRHYKKIAEEVDLPQIVYNIPSRTGRNIEVGTMVRLAGLPNIAAVKEASGSIMQIMETIEKTPDDFAVLSGDDAITLPLMAAGGTGLISVASNIYPQLMVDFVDLGLKGDFEGMRKLNKKLMPMFRMMGIEQNPLPVKAALAIKNHINEVYRLPLCELRPENRKKLADFLKSF